MDKFETLTDLCASVFKISPDHNASEGDTVTKPVIEKCAGPDDNNIAEENDGSVIEAFLDKYGVSYTKIFKEDRVVFELPECPENPSHGKSAIIQYSDGKRVFKCFHLSCQDIDLQKASSKISNEVESLDSNDILS
jgi:hypothetical protein